MSLCLTISIPSVKIYTESDFRQLVVTIEATPAFLGGFGELEDHAERGPVGQAGANSEVLAYDCSRSRGIMA